MPSDDRIGSAMKGASDPVECAWISRNAASMMRPEKAQVLGLGD
ncbi:MAG: hypothetical protein ABIR17_11990 [Pseudolysinimonas sp.]